MDEDADYINHLRDMVDGVDPDTVADIAEGKEILADEENDEIMKELDFNSEFPNRISEEDQ